MGHAISPARVTTETPASPILTAMVEMEIALLGEFKLEVGGTRVDPWLPGQDGRALVAVLAIAGARGVLPDELAAAVWPDEPDADARLRALLPAVRAAIAPAAIEGVTRLTLVLPPGCLTDVEQARALAARARVAFDNGRPAATVVAAGTALTLLRAPLVPWLASRAVAAERCELATLRAELVKLEARALELVLGPLPAAA
jgi:hypothetical protein